MGLDPSLDASLRLRKDPTVTSQTERPSLDLPWPNLDGQYGVSVEAGRRGLTLDNLNQAAFPPTTNKAAITRCASAAPRPTPAAVPMLYEEAVQRQWSSATDIPWDTIAPLPNDLEHAICQFCTFLTEFEFIAADIPGQWLTQLSPEYFEVGLFLMTQIMDEARHMDVFRKHPLANGGGLLAQGPTMACATSSRRATSPRCPP